ncbi:UDP-galactose transporter [Trypanosoma rangeli]|uniref:UDP-galactose transporter n=1 Tax=Trypanosoma rangeli TaxID=5698 RepID=A0A3S5IS46_TRYRA|nr:UDP-galactose transporter [Trypanosoma rangeli]RNF09876.1 UDP-galactose transporter [Trypanosoma rangeli]|eukprot:RNF09876.1 UDP-galactose transporter [Trypanosoma rangeli]
MPGLRWASPATLSLVVLVLQNCSLVIMTRYSRVNGTPESRYHTSTLVLNQEILKMLFCVVIFAVENRYSNRVPPLGARDFLTVTPSVLTSLWRAISQKETLKLSVPAALFMMQNYLIFIGLSNLDAVSFQVWSQTKLVSAAAFSVILLKRRLSMMQWLSLFVLIFGVLLTQLQGAEMSARASLPTVEHPQRPLLGVVSCVLSGLSSSYAGVYFEKVVKTTPPSLAVRNIHLSLFGIPFAVLSMFFVDILPSWKVEGKSGQTFYFWRGYDQWLTIGLVFVHALGGLLVAIVVKYADNIVKGFATGVAVAVSGILSFIIWGQVPSEMFVWGCCLITASTVMYHRFEEGACNGVRS